MNIILDRDEHCFGRLVENPRFHIDGFAVSARHCKIYRTEDADTPSGFSIFLKDHRYHIDPICNFLFYHFHCLIFLNFCSTNGTFLNWEKVTKHVPEVRMQHGDIVSFIAPPHRGKLYLWFRSSIIEYSSCLLVCTHLDDKSHALNCILIFFIFIDYNECRLVSGLDHFYFISLIIYMFIFCLITSLFFMLPYQWYQMLPSHLYIEKCLRLQAWKIKQLQNEN